MPQFSYKALQKGRGTDASFGVVSAPSAAHARKEVAEILRDRKRSGLVPKSAKYKVEITERGQNPASIRAQVRKVKVYDNWEDPNVLKPVGLRTLHEGRYVYVNGERWHVRNSGGYYVLDGRAPMENPASIRAQVRRLPSGQIQLKIPIGRSENPHGVIDQLKKLFGKRVKAVEMVGGKKRNPKEDLPEKEIGDFTVAVVYVGGLNGPYAVKVFGGPHPRTLETRFETVAQASQYLKGVSSKTLTQHGF